MKEDIGGLLASGKKMKLDMWMGAEEIEKVVGDVVKENEVELGWVYMEGRRGGLICMVG